VQDINELNKDFDEIFKMIVTKINLSLKQWYSQLWVDVLKEINVTLTNLEKKTVAILHKDIEQYFLKKYPLAVQQVQEQLNLHSVVMKSYRDDYKLE